MKIFMMRIWAPNQKDFVQQLAAHFKSSTQLPIKSWIFVGCVLRSTKFERMRTATVHFGKKQVYSKICDGARCTKFERMCHAPYTFFGLKNTAKEKPWGHNARGDIGRSQGDSEECSIKTEPQGRLTHFQCHRASLGYTPIFYSILRSSVNHA